MSCAYRHAAARIATIAGIPTDLMLTAMDIARQRRVTFPTLPPDRLRTITRLLGISSTCGNPQQVIARAQSALIALGTLHSTHPSVERWMAIATALLGVPEDHLPVPVHPEIMATVRAQWAAPPRPARSRRAQGIAALWRGKSIPAELIEEAIRLKDRTAIVTWMAYGVWDDRFEAMCWNLTDEEIGTIVRAGVVPDAVVERIAEQWWSDSLPWEIIPFAMWDRVPDPTIARAGRARTAAAKLARNPALRDDQLIAAAAEKSRWAGHVLVARHDLSDDRLIAAVATDAEYAHNVLCARHDLTDDRLITAAAEEPWSARVVLIARHDLSDDRLIDAVATKETPSCARDVIPARHDLSAPSLIAAVIEGDWYVYKVPIERPDLCTDARLLTAIARNRALLDNVLTHYPDLRDHPILAAVRDTDGSSG